MTFPPRLVSILVPVHCLLVLLGWALCRKLVRLAESQGDFYLYRISPMPGIIWFAVHLGWVVGILSCAWGVAATLRADVDGNVASLRDRDAQAGLALTAIVIAGMLWCIMRTVGWVFSPTFHLHG